MPLPDSDPDGFASFMREHQDMVFATAVRIVADSPQAEDIAQTVFIRAWERFAELRAHPSAPGWLRTVATNLAINHVQRYRRRLSFLGERLSDEDETGGMPELVVPDRLLEEVTDAQRQALVEGALRELPAHQRLPLVLFHFEEWSYPQIAEHLQVSVSKVKTDIFRGRAALLRKLGARPATSDLAAG
jgi:RNA polymerase sigma-70 factor (ECF subfamily)